MQHCMSLLQLQLILRPLMRQLYAEDGRRVTSSMMHGTETACKWTHCDVKVMKQVPARRAAACCCYRLLCLAVRRLRQARRPPASSSSSHRTMTSDIRPLRRPPRRAAPRRAGRPSFSRQTFFTGCPSSRRLAGAVAGRLWQASSSRSGRSATTGSSAHRPDRTLTGSRRHVSRPTTQHSTASATLAPADVRYRRYFKQRCFTVCYER